LTRGLAVAFGNGDALDVAIVGGFGESIRTENDHDILLVRFEGDAVVLVDAEDGGDGDGPVGVEPAKRGDGEGKAMQSGMPRDEIEEA
jgi:hypothetical protein